MNEVDGVLIYSSLCFVDCDDDHRLPREKCHLAVSSYVRIVCTAKFREPQSLDN